MKDGLAPQCIPCQHHICSSIHTLQIEKVMIYYIHFFWSDLPVVAKFWIDAYIRLNCITFERCHGFVLTFCLHSGHRKVCFESFRSQCEQ